MEFLLLKSYIHKTGIRSVTLIRSNIKGYPGKHIHLDIILTLIFLRQRMLQNKKQPRCVTIQ